MKITRKGVLLAMEIMMEETINVISYQIVNIYCVFNVIPIYPKRNDLQNSNNRFSLKSFMVF